MDNPALMIWSVLFGAIGIGFFTYGSRQRAIVPWLVGTALMVDSWFIRTVYLLVVIDIALIGIAYSVRL